MTDDLKTNHMALVKAPWKWRMALCQADLPASAFKVGIALIDGFTNRKTGAAFPSVDTISEKCRLSIGTAKDGIKALRKQGLIHTKKMRFNTPTRYFFAIPDALRADENPSTRGHDERMKIPPSNGWESTLRTDENPSTNLSSEPKNVTSPPSHGPDDDGLRPSPLRSDNSSLRSESSSSVVDQPSAKNAYASPKDAETEADDTPIPMPATYELQSRFIHEITEKRNAIAMQAILDAWAMDKLITKRKAREIFEKCERERIAS
ncbi:helix-turn-helix domain-containing protein [Agrobacterium rhizogenes]|uniref:helix-turn-helix domain-containing protein n=1 Tax=Rhizobium rhizogenes TaxID=359 RepID=UPI0015734CA8|nr:helix-turn-helix domain-containing protein [Rhizobium rhizogenes]NTI01934.1 helix-turn-helix domain-containing protein [Rhizobium rhizogenes]NTI08737.1 helix-turn-helix domain-containing protein [Rhizobium rhizogenes]